MERYQLCCCCLELVCLKSLWRQYPWMDRTEVYGDMLTECFGLSWERKDETKDLICEVCITRLRNAVQFKHKVLQSQSMLRLQLADGIKPMKVELIDIEVPQKQEFDTQIVMKIEREDDCDDVFDKGDDFEVNNSELPPIKEEKLILEVGSVKDLPKLITVKRKVPDIKSNLPKGITVKRKVPEIKSTLPKGITVKRKVPDIKSILPKGITVKRKVPEVKSNSSRKLTPKRMFVIESHKAANPRHNVALVLHHSTIVPFKSRSGYFNCFYCNKQFAAFDKLKSHVNELHENITLKKLYQCIYRPNDRIRADVSDINCRICKKKIDNLNFLIQHLTDDHNVKFNFHSDTIKPAECILGYDLSEGKFRCCECKKEFVFFKTLSHHMNEHSTEHICDVCGRCFLLADRLRAHSHTHKDKSNVECDTCGKIFGSKMLLKSHIRYKHQKLPYMCSICNKSFKTSLERIQHLEEVHHRAPPDLTCKICFKMFDHHINLNRHMKFHSNITLEPKHKCNVCGMKFSRNSGLSNHIVVHSGEKNFECEVCHKRYGRRKTLMEHLRIHKNDRRFACGACSQAFVQKCSLKNHIKVHHGDVDFEKLIVDKKLNAK